MHGKEVFCSYTPKLLKTEQVRRSLESLKICVGLCGLEMMVMNSTVKLDYLILFVNK